MLMRSRASRMRKTYPRRNQQPNSDGDTVTIPTRRVGRSEFFSKVMDPNAYTARPASPEVRSAMKWE